MFKVGNKDAKEICSKLIIKVPSDFNDVLLMFLLLTLNEQILQIIQMFSLFTLSK